MWAIASDIHANFGAFRAVLDDIDAHGVEKLFLLGDLVGYGPDPLGCIDLAMDFATVNLCGNFENAVLPHFDLDYAFGTENSARRVLDWTRRLLLETESHERLQFLRQLPLRHFPDTDVLLVHASPRHPLDEYLFPEDLYNPRKLEANFAVMPQLCFHGHTHLQGMFLEQIDATREYEYVSPTDCSEFFRFDTRRAVINVGSVGQPRDGDPRASYVLFDGSSVRFRRVSYDVNETVRLIRANPDLDDLHGDRLGDGR